jgi:hypothetical protein
VLNLSDPGSYSQTVYRQNFRDRYARNAGPLETRDYSTLIVTRMGQFLSFDQVLYGSQDCPMIWMNGA